jgi:hypothetical protein
LLKISSNVSYFFPQRVCSVEAAGSATVIVFLRFHTGSQNGDEESRVDLLSYKEGFGMLGCFEGCGAVL